MVRHGSRSMPTTTLVCNYCSVHTFYAFACAAEAASPWGPVHLAATGRGVVAVELLSTPVGFEAALARRGVVISSDRAGADACMLAAEAAMRVGEALGGGPASLETLPIDIDDRPAWDQLVLGAVRAIPRGSVASYGEIARRVGRPGAARAVGGAVGRNPVGLLVPCHRVIAADGSLGGYGAAAWGGIEAALDLKRSLLALEGVWIDR